MKRRRFSGPVGRIGRAGLLLGAAVGLLLLPVDWAGVGRSGAAAAAGLLHPGNLWGLLAAPTPAPPLTLETPPAALPGIEEEEERPVGGEVLPQPPIEEEPALPAFTHITPPGADGSGGRVIATKMKAGERLPCGIAVTNRSGKQTDVEGALKKPLSFTFEATGEPQVLILHTHTTEQYMTYDGGYYNKADLRRTRDHKKNVCAVGEAIRLALQAKGIAAIHDTTVHDDPVYTGAYTRSAATAEEYLKKYPSIKVVLDVHRDAVTDKNRQLYKPTVEVNGKKAAQMMLVIGTVSTEALPHPHWEQNLTLAARLQQTLGEVHPELMRPLNTVASRYNQHLSPGWLLLETGSEGNTVEEAVYAGQLFGTALARVLMP